MEQSTIIKLGLICLAAVAIITVGVCGVVAYRADLFTKNGYVQGTLPGVKGVHWIKQQQ